MGPKSKGLVVESRILVPTRNGEREIQLCLGDITKLEHQDKVDVILVSAAPGDYSTSRTSVIGALKYNVGIDVRKLSFKKKQDLRKHFNCWISEPLPEKVPFRQLMCFERGKLRTLQKEDIQGAVSQLFRAMMPLFNNKSKTVITPLLATGMVQKIDRAEMMKMTVQTAVRWMQIGLPLQTLKIVVYCKDVKSVGEREKGCVEKFKDLKKVIDGRPIVFKEQNVKDNEVFIVNSPDDQELADVLKNGLKEKKKVKKVITLKDVKVSQESWESDVFLAMMSSSLIIPLLSKGFLDFQHCIDQYNVALCCNRFTRRNILAPICLERFDVPLYMGIVQWINCKERDQVKLKNACEVLHHQVSDQKSHSMKKKYDIFLSYCHKNLEKGKQVLSMLLEKNPDFNIFFDYEEIKTGVSWQQTLYNALDSSSCVIALISPHYMKSVVCMEEFNIALGRHLSRDQETKLIPVCIETTTPESLSLLADLPLIDASGNKFDTCIPYLCDTVCEWIQNDTHNDQIFGPLMESIAIDVIQMAKRKQLFYKLYHYHSTDSMFSFNSALKSVKEKKSSLGQSCDLFISYSLWDQRYVHFIAERIKHLLPEIRISNKMENYESQITEAKCLLVVLSSNYLKSPKEVDELNFILSKERTMSASKELYVLQVDDQANAPTYVKLLFHDTCLTDDFWQDFVYEHAVDGTNKEDMIFHESICNLISYIAKEFQEKINSNEAVAQLKVVCDLVNILSGSSSYHNEVKQYSGMFINVQSCAAELEDSASYDVGNEYENQIEEPSTNENVFSRNENSAAADDVPNEEKSPDELSKFENLSEQRRRFYKPAKDLRHSKSCQII